MPYMFEEKGSWFCEKKDIKLLRQNSFDGGAWTYALRLLFSKWFAVTCVFIWLTPTNTRIKKAKVMFNPCFTFQCHYCNTQNASWQNTFNRVRRLLYHKSSTETTCLFWCCKIDPFVRFITAFNQSVLLEISRVPMGRLRAHFREGFIVTVRPII